MRVHTRVDSAWFQRLELKCDMLRSSFACNSSLRPFIQAFVAAYNDREGKPPTRVEADEERTYLTARYGPADTVPHVIQRV